MTLPSSGQISFADINTELGRGSTSQIGLQQAETGVYGAINTISPSYPNGVAPHSMNEWYGYDHNATTTTTPEPTTTTTTPEPTTTTTTPEPTTTTTTVVLGDVYEVSISSGTCTLTFNDKFGNPDSIVVTTTPQTFCASTTNANIDDSDCTSGFLDLQLITPNGC